MQLSHIVVAFATIICYLKGMMKKPSEKKIDSWAGLIRAQTYLLEQIAMEFKQAELPPLEWYDVLLELKRAPEGKLRFNEIGARILLSKSNISRLIDRLEKEKLLVREHCGDDRRGLYAVITEKGRELQKAMWPVYASAINKHFASKLSEAEAKVILSLMQRLILPSD
jgi:DNA-binding MarR family transcriptional regulator